MHRSAPHSPAKMPRAQRTRGRNPRFDPAPSTSTQEGPSEAPPAKKRRGNLPKESVGLMKAWLKDHATQPYPSEEEKATLALQGDITVDQVSNWFINARRRVLPDVLEASGISASEVTISRRNRQRTRPSASAASSAAPIVVAPLPPPVAATTVVPQPLAVLNAAATVATAYASSTGQCSPGSVTEEDHDYCTPAVPKPALPTADQMHNFDTLLHVALGELHAIHGSMTPFQPELIVEEAPTVEIAVCAS